MSMRPLPFLFVAAVAMVTSTFAHAGDLAPLLAQEELREVARDELRRQLVQLAPADQAKLAGTYVAIANDASDPLSLAACDDDGDHVVVVSDAMLRLVAAVARGQADDEANGTRKVEDYASYLGRAQVPGQKLLPPPPGFYATSGPAEGERLHEAMAFVVGHELARLRAGDVTCPRPTATKEAGDDEWTRAEQRRAMERAERVYSGGASQTARDDEAVTRADASGRGSAGVLGLLRFFEQLERERLVTISRFTPTYLTLHPSSVTRAATVRAAAAAAEARRKNGGRAAPATERLSGPPL